MSYLPAPFAKRDLAADILRTNWTSVVCTSGNQPFFRVPSDSTGLSKTRFAILPGSLAAIKCTLVHLFTGVGDMPKQKTHKGMKRRFKITASGKAKHRSAFRGHLLSGKSAKRKRGLRNSGITEGKDAKNIVEALRPSL